MNPIGFSTGALALGDFRGGIALQRRAGIDAIELSALREGELKDLVSALPDLDLSCFRYCSFHAPSSLAAVTDTELVDQMQPVIRAGIPVVVHPDILRDFEAWRSVGPLLLLENMDRRKRTGRTVAEMVPFFRELPDAKFCFDIGHARQVDNTMGIALEFLRTFRGKLAELHISEVTWTGRHIGISTSAALAFQRAAPLIPNDIPVIIESPIDPCHIDSELQIVHRALDPACPLLDNSSVIPCHGHVPDQVEISGI